MNQHLDLHVIQGKSTSHTILQAYEAILNKGIDIDTRNGAARTIFNAVMFTESPRHRHLALLGRNSNIFQMIAETLWVLSGSGRVTGFLEYFLPRALNYSDDGITWRGAYGPRLMAGNQLDAVVDAFVQDGLRTRRAIAAIYNPSLDTAEALVEHYGLKTTKDLPCNLLLNFYTDALGRFCCKLVQRSGDVLFGAGSINPFEFTVIQELVYQKVKEYYPDLELGPFVHDVTNLHLYEQFKGQAETAVGTEQPVYGLDVTAPTQELWAKCSFENLSELLTSFIEGYENYITDPSMETCDQMEAAFAKGVKGLCLSTTVDGNLLVDYMFITMQYLKAKLGGDKGEHGGTKTLCLSDNAPKDLVLAIFQSKFNPFKKVYQYEGVR